LEYLENPGGWKPVNQERSAASQRNDRTAKRQPATNQVVIVNGLPVERIKA
jgi:hypothetical protein